MGVYFKPNNANKLVEILKNKWDEGTSGPDLELEETAKRQLEQRITDFGKNYQKIILEALELR